jgi:hypothetical protein
MSETRWPANSFDEARDEVIATLRTYRVERMNIQRCLSYSKRDMKRRALSLKTARRFP